MTGDDTTIALDAFFDFDKHDDAERLATDPTVTSKEMVDDEFRRYLTAESTNWRVNNVMDWWSINEGDFPNIAKMSQKYLAVPASSAPSERVFFPN